MSQPILPAGADFLRKFRDLERRLEALERGERMPYTSQRGGTFELLDDQGRPVFYFGTYTRGAGTGYGVLAEVPDGAGPGTAPSVFEVDDDGLEAPYLDIPFAKANDFLAVTSPTFVTAWSGNAALAVAMAVRVGYTIGCDAGTTGEVRVVAGARTSSARPLAAGVFNNGTFDLLLMPNVIGTGPLGVHLQARRTGGAGNVNVYPPTQMAQAGNDGIGATTTGD
jgi:hypothetical protein